jgi:hypothetical protein
VQFWNMRRERRRRLRKLVGILTAARLLKTKYHIFPDERHQLMIHHWDDFSKSLADKSVPRRQSLRLLGAALVAALLSPLGVRTAWAGGRDSCKAFCRCSGKSRQDACLAACRACNSDTTSLCGSCASGYVCTDLAGDLSNCGACGHVCAEPGPYEDGACVDGHCFYSCAQGAADCGDGGCADLSNDPNHCGACGHVCWPGPFEDSACFDGECVYECVAGSVRCDGTCTSLESDPYHCGACGNVCPAWAPYCNQGACGCPSGMAVCDGECIDIQNDPDNCGACGAACPSSAPYCRAGHCLDCSPGLTMCFYGCADLANDANNCGACGHRCGSAETCSSGSCQGFYYGDSW